MKRRIEQLKLANEIINHKNPAMKEEVNWIIEVAEYYENKIREMYIQQSRLENGEIDGFDFGEAVSEIIDSTYIRI